MVFFSYLKSDILKTKRLPLRTAHIVIPIVMVAIFTAYYSYSTWNESLKLEVYYEVLGIGLPVLIGLFCSMVCEQELSAGTFQSLLMAPTKVYPFLSKLVLLLIFGMVSLFLASTLFWLSFHIILGKHLIPLYVSLLVSFIMLLSSIPLYVFHLYLAFCFNKGISIGLGIVESLICALFLTDMGRIVWKYTPAAWPAKMPIIFLSSHSNHVMTIPSFYTMLFTCLISNIIIVILFIIWATHWEGNRHIN